MKILALRFAAPLQSWGSASRFYERTSEHFPTKSGVIGLIGSALGMTREDPELLPKLSSLDLIIREDRRGELLSDYHTTETAGAGSASKISNRWYLQGAVFLVGVYSTTGDDELLEEIRQAIESPAYALFFGRKACVPEGRIVLGIEEFSSPEAFVAERQLVLDSLRQISFGLRADEMLELNVVASSADGSDVVSDEPISLSASHRAYAPRSISRYTVSVPNTLRPVSHDPFVNTIEVR